MTERAGQSNWDQLLEELGLPPEPGEARPRTEPPAKTAPVAEEAAPPSEEAAPVVEETPSRGRRRRSGMRPR